MDVGGHYLLIVNRDIDDPLTLEFVHHFLSGQDLLNLGNVVHFLALEKVDNEVVISLIQLYLC